MAAQSMFPCVAFSEGRKSVNTLGDMSTHGAIGCIFYTFNAKKVSPQGYILTQSVSTQVKIKCIMDSI